MAKRSPILACTLCALMAISTGLHADVIQLNDGSSINGEIMSLKKGIYTIRSSTMGILKLRKSQVRSINTGDNQQFVENEYAPDYYNINQSIQNNSGLLHSINGLNSDPLVKQILQDPELMKAIRAQDFSKLQNNPLILQLMNKPQIKAIAQQLQ